MKTETTEFRPELKEAVVGLRKEVKDVNATLRVEIQDGDAAVRDDMRRLQRTVDQLTRSVARLEGYVFAKGGLVSRIPKEP